MITDVPVVHRGRPRVSSRDALEETAVRIFLERGYDETTVDAICAAAGVSRTTFFRYFDGKSELVWHGFDQQIEQLRLRLANAPRGLPTLDVVRFAVVGAARDRVESSELWRDRFQMYDSLSSLRAEESERWLDWQRQVADAVSSREDVPASVAAAIAGAVQALYVSELRLAVDAGDSRDVFLSSLDARLAVVCGALQALL